MVAKADQFSVSRDSVRLLHFGNSRTNFVSLGLPVAAITALLPVRGHSECYRTNDRFGAGREITVRNGVESWMTGHGRVPICRREHPMTGPASIAAIPASDLTQQPEWLFLLFWSKW